MARPRTMCIYFSSQSVYPQGVRNTKGLIQWSGIQQLFTAVFNRVKTLHSLYYWLKNIMTYLDSIHKFTFM